MINHARTLLLNATSGGNTGSIGEEYVPPSFVPVQLPSSLQTARKVLFGAAPDRAFLNLRGRDLLQLLHETELSEFVYALDPRVTYWPEQSAPLFGAPAKISIEPGAGQSSRLFVIGTDAADLGAGKCAREYFIEVAGSNAVVRLLTTGEAVTTALEIDSYTSQEISFPRSPLSFRITQPGDSDTWLVKTVVRPAPAVATLLPSLELLGEPVFLELFGVNPPEPFATFKSLWFDHPATVYRLGGLVLALIYRTNEIKLRTNGQY